MVGRMSLFEGVERLRYSLDYHLARHNVLTANLAHVDTPGFQPLDVERRSFHEVLGAEMARSNEGAATQRHQGSEYRVFVDRSVSPGLDGNGMSLDREAVKIAVNQLRYDAVSSLTSSELSGLAWAANDGRSGG